MMKFQFIVFSILFSLNTYGQNNTTPIADTTLIIEKITIVGNKHTKERIIRRELDVFVGDTLSVSDTATLFQQDRNKIFNTSLFTHVDIFVTALNDNRVEVIISVNERWYIWPYPIFELADRNFSEWATDRNKDPSRVNYGLRFTHDNFRGRKEELKLVLQAGFTKKYELFYTIPYLNKSQTIGAKFFVHFSTNKDVAFRSNNHKLEYLKSEDLLRKRFYTGADITVRPNFYETHLGSLKFYQTEVADTISILNPDYFLDGRTTQRFLQLDYRYTIDKRNIQYYPTAGYFIKGEFQKLGLGVFGDVNQTVLLGTLAKYWPFHEKLSFTSINRAKFSFPTKQAYFNQRGLGWGEEFVRGYELYVVDGQSYFLNRTSLKYRLIHLPNFENRLIPFKQFKKAPFSIFLKAHADYGYVADNTVNPMNNTLSNRSLYGFGPGIDVITYYDIVWRFEYSFNSIGESRFFIHFAAEL